MTEKYDHYLTSPGCKTLKSTGYEKMLENIIEDDENFITEKMKTEFFELIKDVNDEVEIFNLLYEFFNTPKNAPLNKKKYSLKGKVVDGNRIHSIELGRVTKISTFSMTFIKAFLKKNPDSHISINDGELVINKFLVEPISSTHSSSNSFCEYIIDAGIGDEKIANFPMWTFEGYFDKVFEGIPIKDLPCILGLPGPEGTEKNYNSTQRIAFALIVPNTIVVKKPTSFDAGINTVWRLGGKTKPHTACDKKYGGIGLEEYIHEPVTFNKITSELFEL